LPLDAQRAVLLIADNHGRVRTMTLPAQAPFTPDGAQRLSLFLNEHLHDELVETLSDALTQKLKLFVDEQRQLAEQAMSLLALLPGEKTSQLYLEGATQLFQQPEFKDVGRVQEVFDLLGERDRMVALLRAGIVNPDPHNSRVVIGSESKNSGIEDISVVSAPYSIDGQPVGMVGILGPRRMPYSKLSGIVEFTAAKLGSLLTRLSQ
jgi:heat-inducible transcriptional repressor